jgi:2-polyprenyl-6-methoxyphenol hydroxylase-like FAD-dependent oxidoreductase
MGTRAYDAVVVGARCAGSTLALALARNGWDVVVVDRAPVNSDTISTHLIYPNTITRLESLGVLDRLSERHELPSAGSRFVALGHVIEGRFTSIGGHDGTIAPRRRILDPAIAEAAADAGAELRLGERVVGVLGAGTAEEPVRGVELASGDRLEAPWVFGADGRGSFVAGALGVERERPLAGELSMTWGYWRGIPDDGYATLQIEPDRILSRFPIEDGLQMMILMRDAELVRGSQADRRAKYLAGVREFPETMDPALLDRAELTEEVVIAPESITRGFFRRPAGPGWALVGDSSHFKHPGTAQGICDAVEAALYVAESLSGSTPSLDGYEEWRDERAREHYEWSFSWGRFPRPESSEPMFRGLAADAEAGQDLRDSFSRLVEPSQVMTKERLGRWFAGAPAG